MLVSFSESNKAHSVIPFCTSVTYKDGLTAWNEFGSYKVEAKEFSVSLDTLDRDDFTVYTVAKTGEVTERRTKTLLFKIEKDQVRMFTDHPTYHPLERLFSIHIQ